MSGAGITDIDEEKFLQQFRQKVAEDLEFLAILHDREPDIELLTELRTAGIYSCLALVLNSRSGTDAMELMHQALATLPDELDQRTLDDLAADYTSIYLTHNISASPEESVWLDEDSLMCQESMFQVRSWYEGHGLEVPDWRLRPDDHLVYQLQFIAYLLKENHRAQAFKHSATFMDEHLLRWLGDFSDRVVRRCDTPYFAGVAALTAAYCEEIRDVLAELLQQPRPSAEQIADRMQPTQQAQEIPVKFMPGMGPVV